METTNNHIVLEDNRKLGFAEYGTAEGYPIIYCHGSQSSRLEMHYDLSFALENNLRIITIDRPGHGISDFNPEGSILGFAKDVEELVTYLKIDNYSVAGMSAGAPFALAIAYSLPTKVNSTAIISGFAPYTATSKQHLNKKVKVMLQLAKSFPFILKIALKTQAKQMVKQPKKALNGFLKIMSEPDQKVLQNEAVLRVIETMFAEAFRNGSEGVAYEISNLLVKDWNFELNQISVPVSFWQGKKDTNVPFHWAEMMKSEIKNAQLNMYPDEGHLIIFQHAEEIFTALKQ